jgi:hypothetical protein
MEYVLTLCSTNHDVFIPWSHRHIMFAYYMEIKYHRIEGSLPNGKQWVILIMLHTVIMLLSLILNWKMCESQSRHLWSLIFKTKIQNQTYNCRDLINNKVTPYFTDRLKPYHGSNEIDPKELSLADKEEFYVGSIIDHRSDPKSKKSLFFKIRWLGYSPEEDTWEPYATIRDWYALDGYIRTHSELSKSK